MAKPKAASQSGLQFQKQQNKDMLRIPKNARIHKRPISHFTPQTSNPKSPSNPLIKTLHVSTSTSFMSLCKRAQKHLTKAENRTFPASARAAIFDEHASDKKRMGALVKEMEREDEDVRKGVGRAGGAKVVLRGCGRAIERAVAVGKWFEEGERGVRYVVEVKTGSVVVVDDIEVDEDEEEGGVMLGITGNAEGRADEVMEDTKSIDDSTLPPDDSLNSLPTSLDSVSQPTPDLSKETEKAQDTPSQPKQSKSSKQNKRRKKKNARPENGDDMPESRTRWVNVVDVTISLR